MSTTKKRFQKHTGKEKGTDMWPHGHCKVCDNMVDDFTQDFCSEACRLESDFQKKKKRKSRIYMNLLFVAYFVVAVVIILFTSGVIVIPL